MSLSEYTAEQLITSARARAGIGDTSVTGSDDTTILRYLNEEMYTRLVPGVMKIHEEFFVVTVQQALASSQAKYRIPARAIGQKLRDLYILDSGSDRIRLSRLNREDLNLVNNPSDGAPGLFYMEGNHIVLVGSNFSGTLEIAYYMRPGELILSTAARQITGVDTTNKILTLASTVPSTWANGDTFDVHSSKSGADLHLWDITGESVGTTTITFTEALDGSTAGTFTAEVGDWLCPAEQAALPALPRELHPVLAQAATVRILESIGDLEASQVAKGTLRELLAAAGYLVDNRIEGKPDRVINRNSIFFGGRTMTMGDW